MLTRRTFMLSSTAFAVALPAYADATLTPEQALSGIDEGSLILIDVRRPEEWQETGVAKGAWLLDMTDKQFGPRLMAVLERNPNHQVAIICRTGNRTNYLMSVLAENKIEGVLDVSAGMAGGPRGNGWIPSGLPTVSAQDAFDAMPKDLTKTP
ncbi:rhodanese-like domain-containing protein [uncultured Shimia sp.]|uniref:rhodanese-like domain-containing protein n=1 Tax=uncultured Shimia sp. TaxID=573152 RepID=UPI0026204A48|nr:rhodanese-like domain-containing protein [uncultured Shimia sp.]